jgi:hypothetical protein
MYEDEGSRQAKMSGKLPHTGFAAKGDKGGFWAIAHVAILSNIHQVRNHQMAVTCK